MEKSTLSSLAGRSKGLEPAGGMTAVFMKEISEAWHCLKYIFLASGSIHPKCSFSQSHCQANLQDVGGDLSTWITLVSLFRVEMSQCGRSALHLRTGKEREGGKKKEEEEEDGKSSWLVPPRRLYERPRLSTFDNENTCVFIVARRSARRTGRGPLLNPIIAT